MLPVLVLIKLLIPKAKFTQTINKSINGQLILHSCISLTVIVLFPSKQSSPKCATMAGANSFIVNIVVEYNYEMH